MADLPMEKTRIPWPDGGGEGVWVTPLWQDDGFVIYQLKNRPLVPWFSWGDIVLAAKDEDDPENSRATVVRTVVAKELRDLCDPQLLVEAPDALLGPEIQELIDNR